MKNYENLRLDFASETVGKWKETYQWIPIFGAFAAISTTFLAGANNLPAPFSTLIGSGALTLVKAFATALLIYVPGVAFISNIRGQNGLFSDFIEACQPDSGFLMWSLVIVLITAAIWLALATYLELLVSAQQSLQAALLGTVLVTEGFTCIPILSENNEKHNSSKVINRLIWILVEWTVAPLVSCFCALFLFAVLRASVLRRENAEKRVLIFLPISYGVSAGLLCLFILYQVIPNIVSVYKWAPVVVVAATLVGATLSLVVVVTLLSKNFNKAKKNKYETKANNIENDEHIVESAEMIDIELQGGEDSEFENAVQDYMQRRVLETVYEEDEKSSPGDHSPGADDRSDHGLTSSTNKSAPFRQLLQSTPNRLIQPRKFQVIRKKSGPAETASEFIRDFARSTVSPAIEYDRKTLIRHALAEKYDEIEDFFGFPQILASCIFALVQSVSEIAPLLSPFGAIQQVYSNRQAYNSHTAKYSEWANVTDWWLRAIGGLSAAVGFFLCGWRLTRCLGGKLTYVSNSRGLTCQLSTVTAIIAVAKLKLPVSSVQAFVGSLVGVGIADDPKNVNWKLVLKLVCGWVLTIVFCCGFAYVLFSASLHSPAYVVP